MLSETSVTSETSVMTSSVWQEVSGKLWNIKFLLTRASSKKTNRLLFIILLPFWLHGKAFSVHAKHLDEFGIYKWSITMRRSTESILTVQVVFFACHINAKGLVGINCLELLVAHIPFLTSIEHCFISFFMITFYKVVVFDVMLLRSTCGMRWILLKVRVNNRVRLTTISITDATLV